MTKKELGENQKTLRAVLAILLIILITAGSAVTALADTAGNAGNACGGAETNTFAQNMDLQTIYLDYGALHDIKTAINVTGDGLSVEAGGVNLSGEKLPATGTTTFTGYSWDYVYPGAATYPDGTKGDVTVHCVLNTIYTATLTTKNNKGDLIPADQDSMPNFGGTVGVWGDANGNNASARVLGDGNFRSEKCYVTATISVSPSSTYTFGTYILPITGDNAYKGDGQAWKPLKLYNPLSDEERIRKEEVKPSGEVYRSNNCELMVYSDGGIAGSVLNKSGVDESYTYGFAVEGSSAGTVLDFGITAGYANSSQNNTIKLQMGDLQHRIWSGSGPNGKIETGKSGAGTDLPGGSFTGEIPSGMPEENTAEQQLMRYVVPDAKSGVIYTMTPDAGYFAKEVSVDGVTIKIPMDQPEGTTWNFEAGVLTQGLNKSLTFTFTNPNASDHSVYVTWRTTPAAYDVTSIDGKGQTQTGKPTFKPADGHAFIPGEYTLIDDDGNPQDSITVPGEGKYTINKETGEVTFVPEPDFVGTAKGVNVRATQNDDDKLTATAKYTPTVVENEETKTVSRDITFTYLTEDGETASKTVTQTLTFKRKGTYNKTTGKIEYPDWEPQIFHEVEAPEIEGWVPNMAAAPSRTVTNPDEDVPDEHIVYNEEPEVKPPVEKPAEPKPEPEPEPEKKPEEVPVTGDDNNMPKWSLILLVAMFAMIVLARVRISKK